MRKKKDNQGKLSDNQKKVEPTRLQGMSDDDELFRCLFDHNDQELAKLQVQEINDDDKPFWCLFEDVNAGPHLLQLHGGGGDGGGGGAWR